MKKRRKVVDKVLDAYKIPSKEVLRHRNEFFGLWRRSDDQTTAWLKRVQNCIRHCKFPTNTLEHLLLDRFICGLNAKELKSIQKAKRSWTTKQLLEHFSKDSNDIAYMETSLTSIQSVHQIENISLAVVKSEPTEEQCVQKDPLNELAEDADSINDEEPKKSNENEICTVTKHTEIPAIIIGPTIAKVEAIQEECLLTDPLNDSKEATAAKFTVDEIEDNLMEAPEEREIASSDDEEFNFQQALKEEIDHELLNSGMQFECEDYKFSVDVNSTVATAANAINGVDIAADASASTNDTTTIDKTMNVIVENLPIDEAPNKRDQQKEHCSDGNKAPINIDSVTPSTTDTTDNDDGNSSESSNHCEGNENDQPARKKKPTKRHTCRKCNRSFDRPCKLKWHIKDVHNGIRDHVCKECGKRYVKRHELRVHARTHTGERPHVCDECGVSYAHSSILARHRRTVHLGLRPHMCQICEKRFKTKVHLEEHLLTHSTERRFVCDLCGQAFKRDNGLRTHRDRVHKQKMPSHACSICNKRFLSAAELKKHSLTHTGERPHSCDHCNKKFTQAAALKLHKNSVHQGLRPHACPHCDERFKQPHHLKQHLTIHTGEKAYSCNQCDMSFALGHHLSSHKKSIHQQKA